MKADKSTLVVPLSLISIGTGWLLTAMGIAPQIDWVWTLGLLSTGLLTLAIGGFNKVTVVIGPFFLLTSCLSVLRQTEQLAWNVEVPVLVIALGILLLIARSPLVPLPSWLTEPPPEE